MHVSSEKPFVVRRFAHRLYLIMVSLILLGIVAEGVLIGPSLFAATHWGRAVHGDLGAALFLLMLLLPAVAKYARLPGRSISLNAGLSVLALIQVISGALGRRASALAALHPAIALLMSGLAVLLLLQGWHLAQQRSGEREIKEGAPL